MSRRYTVVTWDPRGVGDNRYQAPSLEAFVDDTVDIMGEVGKPGFLFGVSLGTWVMSRVALRAPGQVEKMVLLGVTLGFSQGAQEVSARRQAFQTLSMAEFARQYAEATLEPTTDIDVRENLIAELSMVDPESYLTSMEAIYTRPNWDVFPEIKTPTLILTGTHDTRTSPREAERASHAIEGSVTRMIPGAGHLALLDAPERVAEITAAFLEGVILPD